MGDEYREDEAFRYKKQKTDIVSPLNHFGA